MARSEHPTATKMRLDGILLSGPYGTMVEVLQEDWVLLTDECGYAYVGEVFNCMDTRAEFGFAGPVEVAEANMWRAPAVWVH